MMAALGIALSGMKAASDQMTVIAENVANADTPGYTRRAVELHETPGGGVAVGKAFSTGQPVNVSSELVDMAQTQNAYKASAAVVDAVDSMMQDLLHIGDSDERKCRHCSYFA